MEDTPSHVIAEIQWDMETIETDGILFEAINFDERANAIDFIEFHIIDRIDGLLQQQTLIEELNTLRHQAVRVKSNLETIDANLFQQLRHDIKNGVYRGSLFREMTGEYVGFDVNDREKQDKIGYDNLDAFINNLLTIEPIPGATLERGPEMVFYQKTPARIVFELIELAELSEDDVFFDIGSGLGQVAILVNLLSGATTIGIEYEPAYCSYARRCASEFNLTSVTFINAEAQRHNYSNGAVFFMYTPFEGQLMRDMLQLLKTEAEKRMIRIFTYGPCSRRVAAENWLKCENGDGSDVYKLFLFESFTGC